MAEKLIKISHIIGDLLTTVDRTSMDDVLAEDITFNMNSQQTRDAIYDGIISNSEDEFSPSNHNLIIKHSEKNPQYNYMYKIWNDILSGITTVKFDLCGPTTAYIKTNKSAYTKTVKQSEVRPFYGRTMLIDLRGQSAVSTTTIAQCVDGNNPPSIIGDFYVTINETSVGMVGVSNVVSGRVISSGEIRYNWNDSKITILGYYNPQSSMETFDPISGCIYDVSFYYSLSATTPNWALTQIDSLLYDSNGNLLGKSDERLSSVSYSAISSTNYAGFKGCVKHSMTVYDFKKINNITLSLSLKSLSDDTSDTSSAFTIDLSNCYIRSSETNIMYLNTVDFRVKSGVYSGYSETTFSSRYPNIINATGGTLSFTAPYLGEHPTDDYAVNLKGIYKNVIYAIPIVYGSYEMLIFVKLYLGDTVTLASNEVYCSMTYPHLETALENNSDYTIYYEALSTGGTSNAIGYTSTILLDKYFLNKMYFGGVTSDALKLSCEIATDGITKILYSGFGSNDHKLIYTIPSTNVIADVSDLLIYINENHFRYRIDYK